MRCVRVRPIGSAPGQIGYGGSFQVQTPNAASIASVALLRLGTTRTTLSVDVNNVLNVNPVTADASGRKN